MYPELEVLLQAPGLDERRLPVGLLLLLLVRGGVDPGRDEGRGQVEHLAGEAARLLRGLLLLLLAVLEARGRELKEKAIK